MKQKWKTLLYIWKNLIMRWITIWLETCLFGYAIEISSLSNRIKAARNSKTELIHPKPQPQRLVEVCKDNLYGLEDAQGYSIVPCVYDEINFPQSYSKLVYICLDDQWAIFDIEGNQLSTFSGRFPDEE